MGLFSSQKTKTPFSIEALETCTAQKERYLRTVLSLIEHLKEFSFDLDEINADQFKTQLSTLSTQFESEENPKKIGRIFEKQEGEITTFIDKEKTYFFNKESELKDIIRILTSGIATVDSENQRFNQHIHEEALKLEQLTQLDDIRKIKSALTEKVAEVKTFIQEKQSRDAEHLEILSEKVVKLKEELAITKNASLTDGLTGAFNRFAFDAELDKWLKITKPSFTLLMFDIDNFKLINDSYGHPVGDRVLTALVQKCKQLIRKDDFLARYGGEEFVVLLADTSLRQGLKQAKRLCETIADTEYAVDEREGSIPLSFTVSLGVAAAKQTDSAASLINRVDKALYKAKHEGKNRVVSEKEID